MCAPAIPAVLSAVTGVGMGILGTGASGAAAFGVGSLAVGGAALAAKKALTPPTIANSGLSIGGSPALTAPTIPAAVPPPPPPPPPTPTPSPSPSAVSSSAAARRSAVSQATRFGLRSTIRTSAQGTAGATPVLRTPAAQGLKKKLGQ